MIIDDISIKIITIALYIDKLSPGYVSEIWIDTDLKNIILKALPSDHEIDALFNETESKITKLKDLRRKKYLSDILKAEKYYFDLCTTKKDDFNYLEFSNNVFGFEIERVSQELLLKLEDKIHKLEQKMGSTRLEICSKNKIERSELIPKFKEYLKIAKKHVPEYILNYEDKGFEIEVVSNEPWSAFNLHTQPFISKLSLNADVGLTDADLHHLSYHEAYAGHHSELSNKDKLLLEGRGEHGLVITYSPQVFISEGIAEGMYILVHDRQEDDEVKMVWEYNNLTFALQNLATHLYFEDKLDKEKIHKELSKYDITEETRNNIINFSTDKVFGRYAPIYFSACKYFVDQHNKSIDKTKFIKSVFSQPSTPSILASI